MAEKARDRRHRVSVIFKFGSHCRDIGWVNRIFRLVFGRDDYARRGLCLAEAASGRLAALIVLLTGPSRRPRHALRKVGRRIAGRVRQLGLLEPGCPSEIGSFEMRAVEDGAFELCAREAGTLEMRADEDGALEMRVREDGAFQMRFRKFGSFELRAREVGSFEPRALEVGSFEVRVREKGAFEMRVREGGAFELRVHEEGSFELRALEAGAFEVRALKIGAFKVRAPEDGSFEMRLGKPSPSEVGASEIKRPSHLPFTFVVDLFASADHGQHGSNVGRYSAVVRPRSRLVRVSQGLRRRLIRLLPARSPAHECCQRFHNGPVVFWAFPGNPLHRIDTTEPDLELVIAELFCGLAKVLCDAPLPIGFGLFLMTPPVS